MTGRWTILAALLTGLVAAGCVSPVELEQAKAAARRANDELMKCQAALGAARGDVETLQDQLAQRDDALAAKDDLLGKIKTGNADLDKAFQDLLAKYNAALAARKPSPLGPLTVLPAKLDAALRSLASGNSDLMEYLPKYGMIKLKSDMTFDKGSAEVRPGAEAALAKLARIINSPDGQAFHVYAAGHTDDIPLKNPQTIQKHGSNWGLSLHRAGAVVKVLAKAGVQQERLGAAGFSKYHPVAPNKPNEGGNPLNRRVELWIVPPDRLLTVENP